MTQKKLQKGSTWELLDKNGDGIVDDKRIRAKRAYDFA